MTDPWREVPKDPKKAAWYYSPWFVLFLILFVLGPLALPLLYKSPRFSRKWKIFWTVFTVGMIYVTVITTIKTVEALKPVYAALLQSAAGA